MSEQSNYRHWRRRAAGLGMAIGCGAIAGAGYAVTSPTDVQVGPHEATIELNMSDTYRLDGGVLGSVTLPNPSDIGFGATLALGEIPASKTDSAIDGLGDVVTQYEQLFTDPAQSIENIKETVIDRAQHDATTGAFTGLGLGLVIISTANTMGKERRNAFRTAFEVQPRHRQAIKAAAVSCVVLAACSGGQTRAAESETHSSPVFADTPLEGAQISGRLMQLAVDTLAPRIIGFIQETQSFYSQVSAHFDTAFTETVADNPLFGDDSIVWIQNISDNHCNIGMDRVHGDIARTFGVSFTIDSGDSTMSGTAAEAECIAQEAGQIDNPIVWTRGNHDSIENTQRQAADNDMLVVDNEEPVEIDGLTIMGEGDPRESIFGTSIRYRGDETLEDQAENLKEAACAMADRPTILLVHSPDAALPTMEAGCATLSISGDTHQLSEPELVSTTNGNAYQFTEGTSGGAAPGGVTVGRLRAPAVQTIFAFDSSSETFVGYYVVTANPDTSVTISDFRPMPLPIDSPNIPR